MYLARAYFNSNVVSGNFAIGHSKMDIVPTTNTSQRFPQNFNAHITQTGRALSVSVLLPSFKQRNHSFLCRGLGLNKSFNYIKKVTLSLITCCYQMLISIDYPIR